MQATVRLKLRVCGSAMATVSYVQTGAVAILDLCGFHTGHSTCGAGVCTG